MGVQYAVRDSPAAWSGVLLADGADDSGALLEDTAEDSGAALDTGADGSEDEALGVDSSGALDDDGGTSSLAAEDDDSGLLLLDTGVEDFEDKASEADNSGADDSEGAEAGTLSLGSGALDSDAATLGAEARDGTELTAGARGSSLLEAVVLEELLIKGVLDDELGAVSSLLAGADTEAGGDTSSLTIAGAGSAAGAKETPNTNANEAQAALAHFPTGNLAHKFWIGLIGMIATPPIKNKKPLKAGKEPTARSNRNMDKNQSTPLITLDFIAITSQSKNNHERSATRAMETEKTIKHGKRAEALTDEETLFLKLANDPTRRPALLARLEKLGLLAAFLAVENGTN